MNVMNNNSIKSTTVRVARDTVENPNGHALLGSVGLTPTRLLVLSGIALALLQGGAISLPQDY